MEHIWKCSFSDVFPTYFLYVLGYSYINKILLRFNLLVVNMTIILTVYESLSQSPINKEVLFISESSVYIQGH